MCQSMQGIRTPGLGEDSASASRPGRRVRWAAGVSWRIAAIGLLATAWMVSSSATGSRIASDLCGFANLILIATVDGTRAFCREDRLGTQVATALEFSVDRVIIGPPLTSLELEVHGGTAECASVSSSAGLQAREGDRFLLILRQVPHGESPHRLGEWKIEPSVRLPDEQELASRWRSLCSACSEGYPSGFPTMLYFSEMSRAQREDTEFVVPQPPLLEDEARCREQSERWSRLYSRP